MALLLFFIRADFLMGVVVVLLFDGEGIDRVIIFCFDEVVGDCCVLFRTCIVSSGCGPLMRIGDGYGCDICCGLF